MSSLRHLRNRFNKGEHDDKKDSKDAPKMSSSPPASSAEQGFELISASDDTKCPSPDRDREKQSKGKEELANLEVCGGFSIEEMMATVSWNSADEKKVFEEQLTQLQEQLMMVMIENQALHNEISAGKDKAELEQVKVELAYERHRSEVLQKDLESCIKKKSHKVHRSNSDLVPRSQHLSVPAPMGNLPHRESSSSLEEQEDKTETSGVDIPVPSSSPHLLNRILHRAVRYVTDFLEDFTEEATEQPLTAPEDPLTVKKLKENIKRFGTEATPYVNTAKGVGELLAWKSPPYTLIVFVVYMYAAWQGWVLPAILFCLTFRLFINYLRFRGWNVSFNFFETVEEAKDSEDKELGVSDKLNLVMSVAKKVQNFLGDVADSLEKIKSALTWRHPEASRQLFLTLLSAFILSCILPTEHIVHYGAFFLGVKLFLIDYIYNRFPRVRRRHDSTYRLWQELPTDIQYEKRYVKSEIDKYILPQSSWKGETQVDVKSEQVSTDDRTFCELFSLPESECPLPGWHGGRRCTLINREKSLTAAFKNGKLFLTHSFLCFERTKVPSPKNIVIPLTDIVRLEKAKPYGWIPGGGMAIEIAVVGNDKPYVFGTILNRDEVYDTIMSVGRQAALSWSAQPLPAVGSPGSTSPSLATHQSASHHTQAAD
ncbi:gram domain-containing protein 4-like [Plakobranchus ocellatus]|uniref:Gram domain-containing protein 4-like n=1 Tax=Plakobranchus ocellatus TaxID=259542 RepID=A0AAV4DFA1_9GAST|nr:gram domain-containing protein 4-like [Plakobranchus ocellatus]